MRVLQNISDAKVFVSPDSSSHLAVAGQPYGRAQQEMNASVSSAALLDSTTCSALKRDMTQTTCRSHSYTIYR